MEEKELREIMLKESEEFKKIQQQHQEYEKELERLSAKTYLSEEDKLREKELKKKKLALKDKMYFLMRKYKKSQK
ncbi:MAG: DUF465 domain-containing protein [Candidatus Aminicenantaceae bacterium]